MYRKLLSALAISSFVIFSNGFAFGKTQNNWSAVEGLVNQEAAVKTKSGNIHYGIIKSVEADGVVLQLAGSKRMTQEERTISRTEVKKVWRALLFVNDRNAGKGALIGAGVGSAAFGLSAVASRNGDIIDNGLTGAAFLLGAVGGAAIGGVVGFFVKKKHKKRDLVFKQ